MKSTGSSAFAMSIFGTINVKFSLEKVVDPLPFTLMPCFLP